MKSKRLSKDAIVAINNEVEKITQKELDYRFKELEKNIIQNISSNINLYLSENSEQIVECSKKNYRKKVRNSVVCMLEGYKDLKNFVECAKSIESQSRINYKINQMIRTAWYVYK